VSGLSPSLETLAAVVTDRLCHRCGSCAGICPASVIEMDADYFPSWTGRSDRCTNCGLCLRVCSGREFSFPEHTRRLFGAEASFAAERGVFLDAFLGYTADPALRADSTSGGLGTELPRFLLRTGRIRGAIAVRADREVPWRPQAFVARTEEDLRAGSYSKYPACSTNHLFRALHQDPGPFLFTGVPCQIHGLRKMMAASPAIEKKIALVVGLFCHSCLDHQALRDVLAAYGVDASSLQKVIYRFGKLPGYVRAQTRSGRWVGLPYPSLPLDAYRPNAKECLTFLFKFYSPLRCRMCVDASAEFADIAISDPWIQGWQGVARLREGYNFILARTPRGLAALRDAQAAGAIVLEPFPRDRAEVSQAPMIAGKRRRGAYAIERRRAAGLPVPEYGLELALSPGSRRKAALHAATYFAAEKPRLRRRLARLLLSALGRWLVGAVFFRRRVLYALAERSKTALRGRSAAD
jgi:coenzyme F420 hydrogenase subunit beta